MTYDITTLSTKLVLDLDSLIFFHGDSHEYDDPIDISPFTTMVISNYSQAWNGFNNIIKLPSNTLFSWELEIFGSTNIESIDVTNITLRFNMIRCNTQETKKSEWEKIFICDNDNFNFDNGTLTITANDLSLHRDAPAEPLSVQVTTVNSVWQYYNLTYSISMTFTTNDQKKFKTKIDPLIKNNSNT